MKNPLIFSQLSGHHTYLFAKRPSIGMCCVSFVRSAILSCRLFLMQPSQILHFVAHRTHGAAAAVHLDSFKHGVQGGGDLPHPFRCRQQLTVQRTVSGNQRHRRILYLRDVSKMCVNGPRQDFQVKSISNGFLSYPQIQQILPA